MSHALNFECAAGWRSEDQRFRTKLASDVAKRGLGLAGLRSEFRGFSGKERRRKSDAGFLGCGYYQEIPLGDAHFQSIIYIRRLASYH